ncbi:MAG: SCO family protein [Rhodocyclales bacterium]|nr:SCO family protein [Rhodocyclales bacterium]
MKFNAGAVLLAGGLVLVLAGGLLTWRNLPNGPAPAGEVPRVVEAGDAARLPDFKLQGPRGEFRNTDLHGHWTFMFFGYTQCPDICPTALALMKEIKAIAVSPAPTFRVVFVSVDPRRDTRELLRDYLAAFDPAFIGVSGSDEALRPLTNALKVDYRRNDEKDLRTYTVDHGAAIHLIDPQGRPAAVFPPPQQAAALAAEFARLARR